MTDLDTLPSDVSFLSDLATLPGSYDGPDGHRDGPYGVMGFGEADAVAQFAAPWMDAPAVASGTQFVLAGGFDFGELGPTLASVELAGADPLVVGFGLYDPAVRIEPGPLNVYTTLAFLAHATGRAELWAETEVALRRVAEAFGPGVPSEENPAKRAAWRLWNRVPLLLSARGTSNLQPLAQQVFARVGRSLAIPTGGHPSGVVSGAFEGRHAFGDDVVALVLGSADGEVPLASEVLESRIAEVSHLPLPDELVLPDDRVAAGVVHWYVLSWVAVYLSLLHEHEPGESPVYTAVRDAATDPDGRLREAQSEHDERALN